MEKKTKSLREVFTEIYKTNLGQIMLLLASVELITIGACGFAPNEKEMPIWYWIMLSVIGVILLMVWSILLVNSNKDKITK